MPKPNFTKQANKKKRTVKPAIVEDESPIEKPSFDVVEKRKSKDKSVIQKRMLILCGGADTEPLYFEGLKENSYIKANLRSVEIDIITPKNGIIDNSVKGLVWEAIQRKRKADKDKNHYDDIWIVTDNDGWNSYRLRAKIRKNNEIHVTEWNFICLLPIHICELIFSNCPPFFISEEEYRTFLRNLLSNNDYDMYADMIISNTVKEKQFEQYFSADGKALFFENETFVYGKRRKLKEKDFDENWKNYVQIAYSCICFEFWLLLHFEYNTTAFLNSEEVITYLNSPRLGKNYRKNGSYKVLKSNPNDQTETADREVINKVKTAISNAQKLKFSYGIIPHIFEINPYTTMNNLAEKLLSL